MWKKSLTNSFNEAFYYGNKEKTDAQDDNTLQTLKVNQQEQASCFFMKEKEMNYLTNK